MDLGDLVNDLSGRVEEFPPPDGPIFWDLTYEFLPSLVDAMFEAALITGTVQAVNIPVLLPANTTYIPLQPSSGASGYGEGGYGEGGYGGDIFPSLGIPAGVIAALRLRLPWAIRKTTLAGLDAMTPSWQQAAPGTTVQAWFPLGVSAFGIYPQLASPQQCMMDFLISPTTAVRPYTTAIPVPFLTEFNDLLPMGAAVDLRSKELGAESEEAAQVMQDYLGQLKGLSLYQSRLDSLVLTAAYGAKAGTSTQKRDVV